MSLRLSIFVAVCISLAVSPAAADVPEALYIFPAGGQRGTQVDVRIGGMHLNDECPLYFAGDGVVAPKTIKRTTTTWFEGPVIPQPDSQKAEDYPTDYAAKLSIDGDARLGVRWWRVSTSQGVTASRRFVVGDLPEITEQEIDGEAIPVAVTLPVTINGRVFPREDVDEWSFKAVKGQTVRCEVEAARLGSPLDSQLEIVDAAGRRLAVNSDHFGDDSLIVFTAPADGEYRVRIFDAAYSGLQPYVYRLTISDRPHVLGTYPLGGRRGEKTTFELAGIGLGAKPQAMAILKDADNDFAARFTIGKTTTNEVLLETSDVAEFREEATKSLTLPCVANGRIGKPGDADVWTFDGVKGEAIEFDLHAASLGSPLDGVLTIIDADDKEVATNDDRSGTESDPRVRFTPGVDGRYTVRVSERSVHRGGADFAYRLHVGPLGGPSLKLTLPTDALTIDRGGSANKFKLSVERGPGVDGELQIFIDGLPPGVTLKNDRVPKGRNDTSLNLTCAADAPVKLHECRVRVVTLPDPAANKNKNKDAPPPPEFKPIEAVGRVAVERGEPSLETLNLFTAMPTPFEVVAEFEIPYAQRGTAYVRHYQLARNGFTGPVTVHLAEKQMRHLQGVQGPTIAVAADADAFDYAVRLPTFLELGRTSRTVVTAVGEVKDEQGNKHTVCFTSVKPSEQISLIIGPGPLSLEAKPTAVAATTEQPAVVDLEVDRGDGMIGPVQIELLVPPHVRGVSAEPIVVEPGKSHGALQLRFTADAGPFNLPLTVRATHGEGLKRVIAETPLEILSR